MRTRALVAAAFLAVLILACQDGPHRVFETCYDWNSVDPPQVVEYPLSDFFAENDGCWGSDGNHGPRCFFNCPPPAP